MKGLPQKRTIIYVNFSPYENSGYILDYLLSNFTTILLFSFQFYKLQNSRHADSLIVYKNGKIIRQYALFHAPIATSLTFFLLPVRSLAILIQILFYAIALKKKYGPYDMYFTVNAFTAWTGNILKKLNLVPKTIFWVWDYYPPIHTDKIAMFMRNLYWYFDKHASLESSKLVFLNQRLIDVRKKTNILPPDKSYPVVSIGTRPLKRLEKKKMLPIKLVFFGVVKRSQGLDCVFQVDHARLAHFKDIELHIIGGGPDLSYYQQKARASSLRTKFYGYIKSETEIQHIMSDCHIGLATYVPDRSNVSYYTDPSKIKLYLSMGLPVITTDVFTFSEEIRSRQAGIIVRYNSPFELTDAIDTIMQTYDQYQTQALTLSRTYYYNKIYKRLFSDV